MSESVAGPEIEARLEGFEKAYRITFYPSCKHSILFSCLPNTYIPCVVWERIGRHTFKSATTSRHDDLPAILDLVVSFDDEYDEDGKPRNVKC